MALWGVIFEGKKNLRQCIKNCMKQNTFMHNAYCITHNA